MHRGGRERAALPFDADQKAAPRAQAGDGTLFPRRGQRRQQINVFVEFGFQKRPAALNMTQQAVRFVLCCHADATNARVEAVRQRKIDDTEFAAEKNRRLGAPLGELFEAAAATAGEHHGETFFRQLQPFEEIFARCHVGPCAARQGRVGSSQFVREFVWGIAVATPAYDNGLLSRWRNGAQALRCEAPAVAREAI